jgi:hypothetical protein
LRSHLVTSNGAIISSLVAGWIAAALGLIRSAVSLPH